MHGACYDANGNIILLPEDPLLDGESVPVHVKTAPAKQKEPLWTETKKTKPAPTNCDRLPSRVAKEPAPIAKQIPQPKKAPPPAPARPQSSFRLKEKLENALSRSIDEGRKQVAATLVGAHSELTSAQSTLQSLPARTRGVLHRFLSTLRSPVRLPYNHRHGKPSSKARLFIVDTVRFGGTFALIFAVLFLGINYQSFWQIARAQLALGNDLQTEQGLEQIVRGTNDITPTVGVSGALGSDTASLVAYLPPVGPFENRIIIPKLGKNIPIVRPSMEALMREDWKTFEEDIQKALHNGIVHYPGSAKPGQAGNFFLTGHSSFYPWDDGHYKDVFARLNDLVIGDTYSVYYNGDRHTYRVISKKEVSPNNVSVLDQPSNQRLATLMTCTPVGTTLRRLIVMAEEIDPQSGEVLRVGERPTEETQQNLFKRLEALPI